jgi:hypothetical protein
VWKELDSILKRIKTLQQEILDGEDEDENVVAPGVDDGDDLDDTVAPGEDVDDSVAPGQDNVNDESGIGPVPVSITDDPDSLAISNDELQGQFAPDAVDPAEASLFLSTPSEAEAEARRWSRFSLVKPGFGLGSIRQNPLARHNFEAEKKRFTNCFKGPKPNKIPRAKADPQLQPYFIPVVQNEYENVNFEDAFANQKMSQNWTEQPLPNNKFTTWENPNSIYFPDNALHNIKPKGVKIPELRNVAGFYGVNVPPSTQGGYANNAKVFENLFPEMQKKMIKTIYTDMVSKRDTEFALPKNGGARFY